MNRYAYLHTLEKQSQILGPRFYGHLPGILQAQKIYYHTVCCDNLPCFTVFYILCFIFNT